MDQETLTPEAILAVIRNPRNSKRKLWTASVVLDRMGIYRRFEDQRNYRKNDRIKVKRLLEQLYQEGFLRVVKETHTLHSATGTPEVAYGLPEFTEKE